MSLRGRLSLCQGEEGGEGSFSVTKRDESRPLTFGPLPLWGRGGKVAALVRQQITESLIRDRDRRAD